MKIHGRRASVVFWAVCFTGLLAGQTAEAVIGDFVADGAIDQSNFTDSVALAIGAASIGRPDGIAIDAANDRVYVSDALNHRVLRWSNASALTSGAPADLVIGQADFSSYGCNRSPDGGATPVTLSSLCSPSGLAVDGSGALYVADTSNCRVLVFDDPYATDTTADHVLGQADGTCDGTVTSASRLFFPQGVAVDAAGKVYVADTSNCRVLEFDGPLSATDATADRVYGQSDFTARVCAGMYFPHQLALSPAGDLYVGSMSQVYIFENPLDGAVARPAPSRTVGTSGCNPNGETSSSTCFPTGMVQEPIRLDLLRDADALHGDRLHEGALTGC
jgi:sugar lactone lactonase YvrE